jgi:type IV pilus assembly protein PilX
MAGGADRMLTRNPPSVASPKHQASRLQSGVVLIIALIVLVAMTLAAIALMRSVDTTNLIAGNLAFQQAATHSGDAGVETAVTWLQNASSATLAADQPGNGYSASGSAAAQNPVAGQSWDAFWTQSLAARKVDLIANGGSDAAGNQVSYVIDRMCNFAGAPTGGASCVASPVVTAATGNAEEAGQVQLNAPSVVYYRITVRIAGPRNTVSYVQAVVSA